MKKANNKGCGGKFESFKIKVCNSHCAEIGTITNRDENSGSWQTSFVFEITSFRAQSRIEGEFAKNEIKWICGAKCRKRIATGTQRCSRQYVQEGNLRSGSNCSLLLWN